MILSLLQRLRSEANYECFLIETIRVSVSPPIDGGQELRNSLHTCAREMWRFDSCSTMPSSINVLINLEEEVIEVLQRSPLAGVHQTTLDGKDWLELCSTCSTSVLP